MEIKWKPYDIIVSFQKQRKMQGASSGEKIQLTGIVTSGVKSVFEDTLLKEGEGNLMKRNKI